MFSFLLQSPQQALFGTPQLFMPRSRAHPKGPLSNGYDRV
jgi:hypothetical protein